MDKSVDGGDRGSLPPGIPRSHPWGYGYIPPTQISPNFSLWVIMDTLREAMEERCEACGHLVVDHVPYRWWRNWRVKCIEGCGCDGVPWVTQTHKERRARDKRDAWKFE